MAAPPPSALDGNQVLQHSFQDDTGRIRVDANITAQDITVEVALDAANDSVRVEDPDTGAHIRVEPDGSVNVNTVISTADGDDIAIHDADGDELAINTDGSINVQPSVNQNITSINEYNEISSVASSTETTIASYTANVGVSTYLQKICVSGENIAEYRVKVNTIVVDKRRTYFGGALNDDFTFDGELNPGYLLNSGDVVDVTVIHVRPSLADFNAKIQVIEVA